MLENLNQLYKQGINVLIVIDEFQDIANVQEAEAKLRDAFQQMDFEIPVIFLGSKQHMLLKIFQRPNAPFYNWGNRVEIPLIEIAKYREYMKERFALHAITATNEVLDYLQQLLDRCPESINRLCAYLIDQKTTKQLELDFKKIDNAVQQIISNRQNEFDAYLYSFTLNEQSVMTLMAHLGKIEQPQSKDVLAKTKISSPGMKKIMDRLMDLAVVYREDGKYVLADPYIKYYLKNYRII